MVPLLRNLREKTRQRRLRRTAYTVSCKDVSHITHSFSYGVREKTRQRRLRRNARATSCKDVSHITHSFSYGT